MPQLESNLEPSGLVVSATAWYWKRQIAQLKQTQLLQIQVEHKYTRSLWSKKKEKKKKDLIYLDGEVLFVPASTYFPF